MSDRDLNLLRRAIELARRSPLPDPNPRVGAVIVSPDGTIVGEGWHHGAGTPPAEIEALTSAGAAARGATAYVSLEPCNHTGRTGPCARALIEAGVVRVVYAQGDPNPQAAGGARTLSEAGVAVTGGLLADEARAINPHWTRSIRSGRPVVTWKVATTLDGRTAAEDGTSQWITSATARADVHRLRAQCGAVVVGTGTALADDPRLTVRHADGTLADRQPLRVVVGNRALPPTARVLSDEAPTLLVRGHSPLTVVKALRERGVHHAWLEGGATLAAAFLRAGLIDEIVDYLAPTLLGAGRPMIAPLGAHTLAEAHRFDVADVTRIGPDIRFTLTPTAQED